jgi:hypothetical protein
VPAYGESGEWYPKFMYMEGRDEYRHHAQTYGSQRAFGYKDFVPRFTAPRFEADAWAALAQRAGARYIVPVAEHHDGFSMFNSSRNRWNAAAMGPRRDVCKELPSPSANPNPNPNPDPNVCKELPSPSANPNPNPNPDLTYARSYRRPALTLPRTPTPT